MWCLWSKHAAPEMQTLHKWLGKAIETPGTLEAAKKINQHTKTVSTLLCLLFKCSLKSAWCSGLEKPLMHAATGFSKPVAVSVLFFPCFSCTVYSVQSACTGCVFEGVAGNTPATPKTKK